MAPHLQGGRPQLEAVIIDPSFARPRVTQGVVGPGRLELPTSRLSGVCSNQLSYRPLKRSARSSANPHMGKIPSAGCAIAPSAWSAAVFAERETETATSRTCLGVFGRPIGSVSVLEIYP